MVYYNNNIIVREIYRGSWGFIILTWISLLTLTTPHNRTIITVYTAGDFLFYFLMHVPNIITINITSDKMGFTHKPRDINKWLKTFQNPLSSFFTGRNKNSVSVTGNWQRRSQQVLSSYPKSVFPRTRLYPQDTNAADNPPQYTTYSYVLLETIIS